MTVQFGTYAHMCRDGHEQIGHRDSEHELCPLCRVIGALRHVIDDKDVTYSVRVSRARDVLRAVGREQRPWLR
jgi:hypothetical protein